LGAALEIFPIQDVTYKLGRQRPIGLLQLRPRKKSEKNNTALGRVRGWGWQDVGQMW